MKYLKIEREIGYFRKGKSKWVPIDEIDKKSLLELLEHALEEGFEMDEFDSKKIANPAHRIIYGHIYERFDELVKNRSRFKDESDNLFKSALEKYSE